MEALYEECLELPEPYPEGKIIFGIDIGGSLTKIAYLVKNDANGKYSSLDRPTKVQMVTFPNGDVDGVIDFIREKIKVKNDDGKSAELVGICCGIGSMKYKERIDKKLGISLEKSDEFECFAKGFQYCRTRLAADEYIETFSDPDASTLPIHNIFTGGEVPEATKLGENEQQFPIILCFIGSGCGFLRVEKDGSNKMVMGLGLGGLYYHGVGQLLTGAKSYKELLSLAKKGNSENVNVLLEDIVTDQYGDMKPESMTDDVVPYKIEGFPFGRIVREGLTPSREDLARTLMDDITMNVLFWSTQVCKDNGVNHCYFAGSFLKDNEPFRTYTNTRLPYMSGMTGNHRVLPRIFKYNGYPGVLGAVLKMIDSFSDKTTDNE